MLPNSAMLRRRLSAAVALLLFFATALGAGLVAVNERRNHATTRLGRPVEHQLDRQQPQRWEGAGPSRRRLGGPGSSPPTCRYRCGRCFPCRPVHVAIQPGRSTPLEYYPEAWRCKCGNKLFMP